MGATDDELERQATELAEKTLPASLPQAVRAAKLPAVKQKILERLRAQKNDQASGLARTASSSAVPATAGAPNRGAPPPPPAGKAPPPPPEKKLKLVKVEGVEMYGDEP
eukprot:4984076-Amphidinium_carterae.1